MENNETKFPDRISRLTFGGIVEEVGYLGDVEGWFKRCMDDFPTMYSGVAIVNGSPVHATMELPPEVIYWFNRWFGQFVEGK